MFTIGCLCPLTVSVVATVTSTLSITATPLSFIVTIVLNGIAIYQLHILDIRPIAMQRVLDWISDCYLVLSESGVVISYNKPFEKILASGYGITESRYLSDCVKKRMSIKRRQSTTCSQPFPPARKAAPPSPTNRRSPLISERAPGKIITWWM